MRVFLFLTNFSIQLLLNLPQPSDTIKVLLCESLFLSLYIYVSLPKRKTEIFDCLLYDCCVPCLIISPTAYLSYVNICVCYTVPISVSSACISVSLFTYISLSVSMSIYLSVPMSLSLYLCLPIYLSVPTSLYLPVPTYVYLSQYVHIYLPLACLFLYLYVSVSVALCLFVHLLPIYRPVPSSICPFIREIPAVGISSSFRQISRGRKLPTAAASATTHLATMITDNHEVGERWLSMIKGNREREAESGRKTERQDPKLNVYLPK